MGAQDIVISFGKSKRSLGDDCGGYVHWAAEVTAANLLALVGVAAMLTVLGLIGFRTRDLG